MPIPADPEGIDWFKLILNKRFRKKVSKSTVPVPTIVSDPYSWNPDQAKNLNPDPEGP